MRGAEFGQFLVLNLDDLSGEVAIAAVPERIDRQYLHVDRHRVHRLQTLLDDDKMFLLALGRRQWLVLVRTEKVERFVEQAMRMHVDGLDALAIDHHRQALRFWLSVGRVQKAATAEGDAAGCCALEKGPSRGHGRLPLFRSRMFPVDRSAVCRSVLGFFAGYIAKPWAQEQSYPGR